MCHASHAAPIRPVGSVDGSGDESDESGSAVEGSPMDAVEVAAAAIIRHGRVLAARRTHPADVAGGWELPGRQGRPGGDGRPGRRPRGPRGARLRGRARRVAARAVADQAGLRADRARRRAGRGRAGADRARRRPLAGRRGTRRRRLAAVGPAVPAPSCARGSSAAIRSTAATSAVRSGSGATVRRATGRLDAGSACAARPSRRGRPRRGTARPRHPTRSVARC